MLLKTIKANNDTNIPDEIEMETHFAVGDVIIMEYDYKEKGAKGYSIYDTAHKQSKAQFTVTNICCNALANPFEVLLTLTTNDKLFRERCNRTEFFAFEEQVLNRMVRREHTK